MRDIEIKEDITKLIDRFYEKLLADPHVRHIFQHLDLEDHLPRVVHFWSFVLLDEEGYRTNVFEKHMQLPLEQEHFDIWLQHFTDAVDELYAGPIADTAKQRATVLVFTFKNKWKALGKAR